MTEHVTECEKRQKSQPFCKVSITIISGMNECKIVSLHHIRVVKTEPQPNTVPTKPPKTLECNHIKFGVSKTNQLLSYQPVSDDTGKTDRVALKDTEKQPTANLQFTRSARSQLCRAPPWGIHVWRRLEGLPQSLRLARNTCVHCSHGSFVMFRFGSNLENANTIAANP